MNLYIAIGKSLSYCSGYMAPEYERSGSLSFKSDIYSFGVLVLEIVSGQRIRKVSFNNIPKQEEGLVQCVSGITLFKMM